MHIKIVYMEKNRVALITGITGQDGSYLAEFLLGKGELKELFKEFEILIYRETNDGKEAKAYLVAKKP